MTRIYDEPSTVTAEEGTVIIDGPDGMALTITPEAAQETSHRLLEAAAEAAGQRRFSGIGKRQLSG